MKLKNRIFYVFDNQHTDNPTADNYTVVLNNGDLLGCNHQPFFPTGIGQHSGNCVDNVMFHKFGYSWRKHCNVKKIVKAEVENYLAEARDNENMIGFEVTDINQLPKDVIKFIEQNLYP
jgi:hypothetical protein